jgi:hypothetical protein
MKTVKGLRPSPAALGAVALVKGVTPACTPDLHAAADPTCEEIEHDGRVRQDQGPDGTDR